MALNRRYKGGTLPEVLVALAITSFCSTLAVIIYINIQQSCLPFIRLKSNELAAKYLNNALNKKDFFDNSYTEEEYTIKKTSIRNELFLDCTNLSVAVYNSDHKKLAELQTIIHAE